MNKKTGKTIQYLRIGSQGLFTLLFLFLFFLPLSPEKEISSPSRVFFYIDPLLLINSLILTKSIIYLFLLSLIPLFLTLVLGRFFCGWICPLGSILQFFSWISGRSARNATGPDLRFLRFKYLVLAAVIVAAVAGTNLASWADPFSLLSRSLSTFTPLFDHGHVTVQPFLIGGLFILILALNAFKTRFFCNVICPLGALYGLVSRFGMFRLKSGEGCNSCLKCGDRCTFSGNAGEKFLKSECLVCFNCVADCPSEAVQVKFDLPEKATVTAVSPGRRSFIGALALGAAAAVLPRTSLSAKPNARRSFLRPPGAIKESGFLDRCERCGQCIHACPTGFIQPAMLQAGVEGLWTPVVNAQAGYCSWDCNRCTQVCPSGAIGKLTLKHKQQFRIGIAVIDKDRCYTYSDGFNCSACEERCPVPGKAILFRETETWNYQGKRLVVKQIYVDPDRCTGCGICEYVCPRKDAPGILITAEDEYRELP